MILGKSVALPIFILFLLFTSMFVSLVSIYDMPNRIMGGNGVYVLTSSTDKNPIRSNLDIGIAYGLENMSYIEKVSPEIFVFTVVNNNAITVRGVLFHKFLDIENGKILSGKIPNTDDGAMLGINVERKLNIGLGDKLTLLGSFSSSIAIVNITGIYETHGPADDEILVSIPTGEKLAGIKGGTVSIIRVKTDDVGKIEKMMNPDYPKFKMEINSTSQVYVGNSLNFSVKIENMGKNGGYCNITLKFQNQSIERRLYVKNEKKMNFSFYVKNSGEYNLTGTVKNDIFYYTCYTKISSLLKPVFFRGQSFAFVNQPMIYRFSTLNNTGIDNATLLVKGDNYSKTYRFNTTVSVVYPKIGNYTLQLLKEGFQRREINISVYKKINIDQIANITPKPINGDIYLNNSMCIRINSVGKVYFSIDNSTIHEGNTVNIPEKFKKTHTLSVNIIWKDYMAFEYYTIHILGNFLPSIILPAPNGSNVVYGENLTFILYDSVPIKNLTMYLNGKRYNYSINQSFKPNISNYTYNFILNVNKTEMNLKLIFFDLWNRKKNISLSYNVLVFQDIIKPIIYASNITIWSGNKTKIFAVDDFAVANLSVYVNWQYQKYFNSTEENKSSLSVIISTYFRSGDTITFVKEGKYNATAIAYDTSGNKNEKNFTITINNGISKERGTEKNPPVIIGNKIINLTSGYEIYKAYDNVAVQWMGVYENSALIKEVNAPNQTTNPLILQLNSTDISNGLHHLQIYAKDVNSNIGVMNIVAMKNYTDKEPPRIFISQNKIWGGNKTKIYGSDNVKVEKISVHAFGRYFNSTSTVYLPTSFITNDSIIFENEGTYSINVSAWDIYGNINESSIILVINNSKEKNPPEFISKGLEIYNSTDTIRIISFDNVGIKKIWIEKNNKTIAENYSDRISFKADLLKCGVNDVKVYAMDLNDNVGMIEYKYLIRDTSPPELTSHNITIWGGNETRIYARDNLRVAGMSIHIFNHYFNSIGNETIIETKFIYENYVEFIGEGTYEGYVKIWDANGNVNYTVINITINNTGEKIAPVILGNEYAVITLNSSLIYHSYDNVGVAKMWWEENGTIKKEFNGSALWLNYSDFSGGEHNITIYSEDVNGNIGMMDVVVDVVGVQQVILHAQLEENRITTNQRGKIILDLVNGAISGYYNLTIYLDGEIYYSENVYLESHERKNFYCILPYLEEGKHTIKVGNITLTLDVEREVIEKLPTDLVLKYSKGLKFSESKGVIYKGFQISEGNFLLVFSSLIGVTMLLIFLGVYSTTMKGLKNENVGILRAIGADNRQIFKFFTKDVLKYVVASVIGGIAGGYIIVMGINNFSILTAFGHKLIIYPTLYNIALVITISFIFVVISFAIIFKSIFSKHVVHLLGREENKRAVNLEEIIGD